MRYTYTLLLLFIVLDSPAQGLSFPGMVAMTQLPVDPQTELVLNLYDARNVVVDAPLGNNWTRTNLLTTNSADPAQFKMSRMGSVFGVTIDGTGNLYVTSSATYNMTTVTAGSAGAAGIYRVNDLDWSVDDFVTTINAPSSSSTTQIPNTGCGLGNINYDEWHDQLFVTNFEDGKIYRLDMGGNVLSTFDPFAADDATSGEVAFGELVWGVAVYQDPLGNARLYFSTWCADPNAPSALPFPRDKNGVFSVALDANGNFTGTEQFEFQVDDFTSSWQPTGPGCPISTINISSNGVLLCAERSMFGFGYLSAHTSRVYTMENSSGTWLQEHLYQTGVIGYDEGLCANTCGGADFGFYDDDETSAVAGCEQLIWASCDAIKYDVYNPDGVLEKVYGLTGIKRSGNSPNLNDPEFVYTTSYMIDLNGDLTDQPKTFQGSCAAWSNCNYDPCENYKCTLINIFTPNGDGKNDNLVFQCIGGEGWELQVFDRWGTEVYKNSSYHNDWNGGALVDGVYYYILTSPCDGRKFNSFFHLLR